jgi:hypothetical protein
MFTLLYWIFCFSFAFDFRGEQGGSAVQYVFLALALGSSVFAILATPKALRSGPTRIMSALWWVYLGTTVTVALASHVPASQYFRCVLPALLFGLALNLGQCLAVRRFSPDSIVNPMLWAGIVSVIWRFINAVVLSHIPIDQVRYEMLSPAIPLLFAAAVASAVLANRLQPLPLLGGALALVSVLISVTRSYVFTLAAALAAVALAFCMVLASKYWTRRDLKKRMTQVFAGALLAGIALVVLYLFQPVVFERWFERLFNDGGGRTRTEVTLLTREAEATAMFHLLEADPIRFVYGKGMGASYYWDSSYFPALLQVYPDSQDLAQDIWVPGHSVWTYALFSGGGFAVIIYIFLFGWLVVMGVKSGRTAIAFGTDSPHLAFLPWVIGFCYFSQTLTANPFGERFSAQILGLCAALPQIFLMRAALHRRTSNLSSSTPQFLFTPHVAATPYRVG